MGASYVPASRLATQEPQRCSLVQGDVVGLVAFDFVLGFVLARVVDVSFVIHVLRMHLGDSPADPPGLRVPADTVMQLESFCHLSSFEDFVRALAEPFASSR